MKKISRRRAVGAFAVLGGTAACGSPASDPDGGGPLDGGAVDGGPGDGGPGDGGGGDCTGPFLLEDDFNYVVDSGGDIYTAATFPGVAAAPPGGGRWCRFDVRPDLFPPASTDVYLQAGTERDPAAYGFFPPYCLFQFVFVHNGGDWDDNSKFIYPNGSTSFGNEGPGIVVAMVPPNQPYLVRWEFNTTPTNTGHRMWMAPVGSPLTLCLDWRAGMTPDFAYVPSPNAQMGMGKFRLPTVMDGTQAIEFALGNFRIAESESCLPTYV